MVSSKAQPVPAAAITWLDPYALAKQSLLVEAGDLSLHVCRLKYEWQLNYSWGTKGNEGAFNCHYLDEIPELNGSLDRIAQEACESELTLQPRLADRPVVVRSYAPLIIPSGSNVTLYVSTPLWLCVEFPMRVHREFAVQQLSDTWMGSLTGEGELCYGSHTHARLDKTQLLNLPYRALTPVTIRNKSHVDFNLERLSIPAPYLSLYAGESQLHTEPLTIIMQHDSLRGTVEIGKVGGKKAIAPPRKDADRGILVSAWENMFA